MSIYVKKAGSIKKSNGHWKVKENCIAEAQKYTTIREWQLKSPGSLIAAYKYKWMFECSIHMRPQIDTTSTPKVEVVPVQKVDKRLEAEKKVMDFLGL